MFSFALVPENIIVCLFVLSLKGISNMDVYDLSTRFKRIVSSGRAIVQQIGHLLACTWLTLAGFLQYHRIDS